MNSGRSYFNSDKGVKNPYGSFEGCQKRILVRKNSELTRFHS